MIITDEKAAAWGRTSPVRLEQKTNSLTVPVLRAAEQYMDQSCSPATGDFEALEA